MGLINQKSEDFITTFVPFATITCMVVMIVGMKLKWFRRRLTFGNLPTDGESNTAEYNPTAAVNGVYRPSNDFDTFVEIKSPITLPPIRPRRESSKPSIILQKQSQVNAIPATLTITNENVDDDKTYILAPPIFPSIEDETNDEAPPLPKTPPPYAIPQVFPASSFTEEENIHVMPKIDDEYPEEIIIGAVPIPSTLKIEKKSPVPYNNIDVKQNEKILESPEHNKQLINLKLPVLKTPQNNVSDIPQETVTFDNANQIKPEEVTTLANNLPPEPEINTPAAPEKLRTKSALSFGFSKLKDKIESKDKKEDKNKSESKSKKELKEKPKSKDNKKETKPKYERVLKAEVKKDKKSPIKEKTTPTVVDNVSLKSSKQTPSQITSKAPSPEPPVFEMVKATPRTTGINYASSSEIIDPPQLTVPELPPNKNFINREELAFSPKAAPRLSKTKLNNTASDSVAPNPPEHIANDDSDELWDQIAQHRRAIPKKIEKTNTSQVHALPKFGQKRAPNASNTASLIEKPKTLREIQKARLEAAKSNNEGLAIKKRTTSESDTEV